MGGFSGVQACGLLLLALLACSNVQGLVPKRGEDSRVNPRFVEEVTPDFKGRSGEEHYKTDGVELTFKHVTDSNQFSVVKKEGGKSVTARGVVTHGRVDVTIAGKEIRFVILSPHVMMQVDKASGKPIAAFVEDFTMNAAPKDMKLSDYYMLAGRELVDLFGGYMNTGLAGGVSQEFPKVNKWQDFVEPFKKGGKALAAFLKAKAASTTDDKAKQLLEGMANAVPNTLDKVHQWHKFMQEQVLDKWDSDNGEDLWTDKDLDTWFFNNPKITSVAQPKNIQKDTSFLELGETAEGDPIFGKLDKQYEKMMRDGIKDGVKPLVGMLDKMMADQQKAYGDLSTIPDNRWVVSLEEQRIKDARAAIKQADFPGMISNTVYDGLMSNPWANRNLVGLNKLANTAQARAEAKGKELASLAEKKLKSWLKKMGKTLKKFIQASKQALKANKAAEAKPLQVGEKEIANNAWAAAASQLEQKTQKSLQDLEKPVEEEVAVKPPQGTTGGTSSTTGGTTTAGTGTPTPKPEKWKSKYKIKFKPDFKPATSLSKMLPKVKINQMLAFSKGATKHTLALDVEVKDPFKTADVTAKLSWKVQSGGFSAGTSITSVVSGVASPAPKLKSVLISAFATYKDKNGLSMGVFMNINAPYAQDEGGKTVAGDRVITVNPYITKAFGNKKTTVDLRANIKLDGFKPSKVYEYEVKFSLNHNFSKNTRLSFNAMHKKDNVNMMTNSEAILGVSHTFGNGRGSLNLGGGVISNNGKTSAGVKAGVSFRF